MVDPPPALVRPVPGPVASRFSYDRAAPFRAGRRRNVRFRAAPGGAVRAPCRGTIRFAGAVPQGRAVAVRCAGWSATLVGLAAASRRAGARVPAGAVVGRAGAGGTVGLGLRRAGDPFGYVDPLPLLASGPAVRRYAPLGPAPGARRPTADPAPAARPRPVPAPARVRAPVPAGVRATVRAHVRAGAPASAGAPATAGVPGVVPGQASPAEPLRVPTAAWVGLALAALGVPAGAARRRRGQRRPHPVRQGALDGARR